MEVDARALRLLGGLQHFHAWSVRTTRATYNNQGRPVRRVALRIPALCCLVLKVFLERLDPNAPISISAQAPTSAAAAAPLLRIRFRERRRAKRNILDGLKTIEALRRYTASSHRVGAVVAVKVGV